MRNKGVNGSQVLSTISTNYSVLVIKWLCNSSSTSKKDIRHKDYSQYYYEILTNSIQHIREHKEHKFSRKEVTS